MVFRLEGSLQQSIRRIQVRIYSNDINVPEIVNTSDQFPELKNLSKEKISYVVSLY
jgi:hypothetical protein